MPTDDNVNASGQTSQDPPATVLTEDAIKAHPLFKDLETKHAAARTGLDTANIELKKLKKVVVGDEDDVPPPEPVFVTKEELDTREQRIRWEAKNESQIELANKNGKYDEYIATGDSPEKALKLALFDEGITNNARDDVRLQSVASAASSVDRSGTNLPDGRPQGMSDELWKSYAPVMKQRQRNWIGFN